MGEHHYGVALRWTGHGDRGTETYRSYERAHTVSIDGKPDLLVSSDPTFRGDATQHNPEELLVAALSSCHMLWYLHLCAEAGVVVLRYSDDASGVMVEHAQGGEFVEVVLRPVVEVRDASMVEEAHRLHATAHSRCFIARSMSFPVRHEPNVSVIAGPGA